MANSASSSVTASDFRAKVAQMKNWTPNRTPTNRDRLELYALHKQAVASDAPETTSISSSASASSSKSATAAAGGGRSPSLKSKSPAERAKLNAWRSKRGLSQSQAMTAYITEADRQIRIYGTFTPHSTTTPINTPAQNGTNHTTNNDNGSTATSSVLLTPRGLAAVPLLCAAASESRVSYLKRLEQDAASSSNASSTSSSNPNSNSNSNGWWMRQEALCGDPGTISALPETLLLTIAILVERASLHLSSSPTARDILTTLLLRPSVLQSILWPLHNVLLVIWILLIFLSTLTGSAVLILRTVLLGRNRTGVSLEDVFVQEIGPCKRGTASLCGVHQTPTVRFLGLVLYPLGVVCEMASGVVNNGNGMGDSNSAIGGLLGQNAGLLLGSGVYLVTTLCLWWYWLIVLPWVAIGGLVLSISFGWCFGLIELANISSI